MLLARHPSAPAALAVKRPGGLLGHWTLSRCGMGGMASYGYSRFLVTYWTPGSLGHWANWTIGPVEWWGQRPMAPCNLSHWPAGSKLYCLPRIGVGPELLCSRIDNLDQHIEHSSFRATRLDFLLSRIAQLDQRTALPDQCLHSAEADVRSPRRKSGFDPYFSTHEEWLC